MTGCTPRPFGLRYRRWHPNTLQGPRLFSCASQAEPWSPEKPPRLSRPTNRYTSQQRRLKLSTSPSPASASSFHSGRTFSFKSLFFSFLLSLKAALKAALNAAKACESSACTRSCREHRPCPPSKMWRNPQTLAARETSKSQGTESRDGRLWRSRRHPFAEWQRPHSPISGLPKHT